MTDLPPFLTDAEIADICAPLQQPAAQLRYLHRLGLNVKRKPNGRPLVGRADFEYVMGGRKQPIADPTPPPVQPDVEALRAYFAQKKRHGKQAT
ncbi:MAG: hypothetical protein ACTHJ1_13730 [Bordetella sp.]|uniref:hypothetical protein n=1 Tax=Bordetella sp. TaxID=28081 RepID=UPI003F7C3D08